MPRSAHPDSDLAVAAVPAPRSAYCTQILTAVGGQVLAGEMDCTAAAACWPQAGTKQNVAKRVSLARRQLQESPQPASVRSTPRTPTNTLQFTQDFAPRLTPQQCQQKRAFKKAKRTATDDALMAATAHCHLVRTAAHGAGTTGVGTVRGQQVRRKVRCAGSAAQGGESYKRPTQLM